MELRERLAERLIGQPGAIEAIVPQVELYQEGFSPTDRPAGIFLLLGPTGTGKTKTAQALAEVLHGDEKFMVTVDCGEYQQGHEIAKLIGAPPGYLGHRETPAALTAKRIKDATTERSSLAIILFDEIEKAAPELTRLLLGMFGRGKMALGDSSLVDFKDTFVFMTSNLGAKEMERALSNRWGFDRPENGIPENLEPIALAAVRRKFEPEFVNRLDGMIVYKPLTVTMMDRILDREFRNIQDLISKTRVYLLLSAEAREWILENGFSRVYGARELKRVMRREILIKFMEAHRKQRFPLGELVSIKVGERGLRVGPAVMEVGA